MGTRLRRINRGCALLGPEAKGEAVRMEDRADGYAEKGQGNAGGILPRLV